MYELKENLRDVSKGAGYIEFSDTLITFGYFVSILVMLVSIKRFLYFNEIDARSQTRTDFLF